MIANATPVRIGRPPPSLPWRTLAQPSIAGTRQNPHAVAVRRTLCRSGPSGALGQRPRQVEERPAHIGFVDPRVSIDEIECAGRRQLMEDGTITSQTLACADQTSDGDAKGGCGPN